MQEENTILVPSYLLLLHHLYLDLSLSFDFLGLLLLSLFLSQSLIRTSSLYLSLLLIQESRDSSPQKGSASFRQQPSSPQTSLRNSCLSLPKLKTREATKYLWAENYLSRQNRWQESVPNKLWRAPIYKPIMSEAGRPHLPLTVAILAKGRCFFGPSA